MSLAVFIAASVSACGNISSTNLPSPTLSIEPPVTEINASATPTKPNKSGWITYYNPTSQFTIEIPSNWYQSPLTNTPDWPKSTIANFDLGNITTEEWEDVYEDPHRFKLDIGLHSRRITNNISLEDWAIEFYWDPSELSGYKMLEDEDGQRIDAKTNINDDIWSIVLFQRGSEVIVILAGPITDSNGKLVDEVIATFQIIR